MKPNPAFLAAEDFEKYGFRCQVQGAPDLDPFEILDRRTARFMSKGTAWNYIAMEQAISDSGLEESDIINPKTGIIMGSGGPSTKTIVEAAAHYPLKRAPSGSGRQLFQRR